ncbi:MAG TPA: ribosome recycling factor [Bacteroidales bacterium]|nr:MAG: ribosome recycling factor [Bacteroidetes bacterium GWE2_42_24]OFY28295.1 MAG: ribosome recycling factor [Bacteroidetes bacterium GWF2_43_11]PKP27875.1 MAG: ribosome recycling factor [Bacteroidetes bacterium HGW-Bacteroidetes-22]HAQ64509.1 ribosome recycling factor [Bacteroidales bacterium]HBZ66209.1 ribosome recycling factor [Bacteroidales bacterium]
MTDESEFCLEEAMEDMQNTVLHLEKELQKIRAGKASPQMLEGVKVDYYGSLTAIDKVSNVSSPDPRQIIVHPWEKTMLAPIEKAIMAANLGFNPQNNGEILRINVPPLTEERRRNLVKQAKTEAENTRIGIRNIRRNAMETSKKLKKDGVPEDEIEKLEAEIQKLTDQHIEKVDKIFDLKEKDIMTV